MDEKQKHLFEIGGVILAIVLVWWYLRQENPSGQNEEPGGVAPTSPEYIYSNYPVQNTPLPSTGDIYIGGNSTGGSGGGCCCPSCGQGDLTQPLFGSLQQMIDYYNGIGVT